MSWGIKNIDAVSLVIELGTEDVTEIPLSFSISIQSETACFVALRPFTVPARLIAPPYNRNFSVSVVLPASGWEMIANVRRLFISSFNEAKKKFSSKSILCFV